MQPQAVSQNSSVVAYGQYQYQPVQAQPQVQGTPTQTQQLMAVPSAATDASHQYQQQVMSGISSLN